MYETIKCEITNKIMIITLNRPERLNAYNPQMADELDAALEIADKNDDVRVVIITGEGRAFCSGADISKGGNSFKNDYTKDRMSEYQGGPILHFYRLKKPIIAAINGPAVGVGITMALPMDIRIASTNAKSGFVFTRRGIVPEACSSWYLPKIVGISKALEWVYSGELFSAEEALEHGLVSKVVPPEELLNTAITMAEKIAENTSAISIALTRQMFWRSLGAAHPMESYVVESKANLWAFQQADAREGVTAFLEKRSPNFTMKPSTDMPEFYPWWEEPKVNVD